MMDVSQDRAVLLSEMAAWDLESIADKCVSAGWRAIGLYFEKTHGFVISYKRLQDRHPAASDCDLRRELFHELAVQGVTIAELAQALEYPLIGLNSVANTLKTTNYHKNVNTLQSQGEPAKSLNSVNLRQLEQELFSTLAWELNDTLSTRYRELYRRMGFQQDARNPGGEMSDLIIMLYHKEGKEGLRRFYTLLQTLEENRALDLIARSSAAQLFFDQEKSQNQSLVSEHKPIRSINTKEEFSFGAPRSSKSKASSDSVICVQHALKTSSTAVLLGPISSINTAIASAFADAADYIYKVWISAASEEQVLQSINLMVEQFKIPLIGRLHSIETIQSSDIFRLIKERLSQFRTLVVFDNSQLSATQVNLLYEAFKPTPTSQFHLLITTLFVENYNFPYTLCAI